MRRIILTWILVLLLVVTFLSCGGGGGGGGNTPINTTPSLTEGSFTYAGTLPAIDNVPFTNRTGDQFVSRGAYVGLVELFVDPQVNTGTVTAAIKQAGGNVVAQTPKIGLYVIQVGSGNENAFLTTMYSNSWVSEGGAVIQAVRGNATLDWNSGDNASCLKYHGSLVTDITNHLGSGFVMDPVSAYALVPQSLADLMLRKFEAVPAGQRQVINMSINVDPGRLSDYTDNSCDLLCVEKWAAFEQYKFLRRFFDAAEQLYLTRPDLANRNLISIISGNAGVALDTQLAGLKTSFPNAFKRIVIVGAVDASGTIWTRFNHLDDNSTGNMVYARGVNVGGNTPNGPVLCSGTSYAAPEVAGVLDNVWTHNPSLTSEQVLSALRQALRNLNTSVIPQDANGRTTTAFLNQVLTILGIPVNPTTFTLTVSTSGTGSGAVSSNPLGPSYTSGTTVTLTATPATGSTFTGWSGACSGTGSCVVTMDAPKTVTAAFTLASPAGSLIGTWSGTWSYPYTWLGCSFNDGGSMSMTITEEAAGYFQGSNVSATGIALLELPSCKPVETLTASGGTVFGSISGNNLNMDFNFPTYIGTIYYTATATVNDNTMSGSIFNDFGGFGVGSFTLIKQ